ncbi:MAG: hypothetical protein E6R03_17635 [Hyphomicrobiaceae bacterium]|nr:MAG: hypothetical protein E6R03_17635 [Hyphomicrobiaceae bacterium]
MQSRVVTTPDWVFDLLEDDTPERVTWVTKGLGAGGTYGLAFWHYVLCTINDQSRFSWSVAPTYGQVQDTLIPTFAEVLTNEFKLTEGRDFQIVRSGRPRIEFPRTGQQIDFKSAVQWERMVGPSVSHISGTELGLWPRAAFEKSQARLRCPKSNRLQYLGEGTPEGFNWWEKEANFPEGIDEERNYRRVILKTEDNDHLPPGYVAKLERTYAYDPQKLESYLRGLFVNFARGNAYWEFRESRNISLGLSANKALPIAACFDFNKTPIAWVACQKQVEDRRGQERQIRHVALAESSGKSRGLLEACAEFIAAFPPAEYSETPIYIYGDASGYAGSVLSSNCGYDQIKQYLSSKYREVSVRASRSNPRIQSRLERMNALFAYRMAVVAAHCRATIRSLTQTALKDGTWDLAKPSGEDWSHWADAWGYYLWDETKGLDLERPSREMPKGLNKQL